MKLLYIVAGVIVGVIVGLWLPMLPFRGKSSIWNWPDSLDAVQAAGKNHKVVFENDAVRILEVILRPHENEPMHTHRLPSFMFGGRSGDTSAFDIVYYTYAYDPVGRRYFIKDSFPQHRAASQRGVADTGHYMKPEQPHGIRNLSNVTIDVYRVEFKENGKHP